MAQLNRIAKRILPPFVVDALKPPLQRWRWNWRGPRRIVPWSAAYYDYKISFLRYVLRQPDLLEYFRAGRPLLPNYGIGIDERCVEYPWVIAQLPRARLMLDAGSTFNFEFVLEHSKLQQQALHIVTLGPEEECFWQKSVSYLFHDLRTLPMRDHTYDAIVSISTLEHIGCDNSVYVGKDHRNIASDGDARTALAELYRVLAPGGLLFLTVPFGVKRQYREFQQFDTASLAWLLTVCSEAREVNKQFYRYASNGWDRSAEEDCASCEYVEWITRPRNQRPRTIPVEPDFAAAARAVACVRILK